MNFDARSIGAIWNENIVAAHPIVIAGSSVADVRGISLNWFAYIDCSFHIVHIVHIIPQFIFRSSPTQFYAVLIFLSIFIIMENTKICTKCGVKKSTELFSKWSRSKDGRFYQCKLCCSEYNKIYKKTHKKELREYGSKYYEEYYRSHKNEIDEGHKKDYEKNKTKWKSTRKNYYEKNKPHILEIQRERLKNPEVRERRRIVGNKRDRERCKTDPNYRIKKTLRTRIWSALKGASKSKKTEALLGCSIQEVRIHLEKQFRNGMSWNNYGKWHIDHIKPCDFFDLTKPEEQSRCFHYTNLQPLWADENMLKNNKILIL